MACAHIPALQARVAELRAKYVERHLQAERADPLNFVADQDDLAAFRLFVHAELEEYLETKAKDGLASIEIAFKGGKRLVRDNHALLVIATCLKYELNFDTGKWSSGVAECIKEARDWVSKNNGIKDQSFAMLSILSGKMPDEIDVSLTASLTSYGSDRGEVAHRSVRRVRTIKAPSVEVKNAEALVNDLAVYFA